VENQISKSSFSFGFSSSCCGAEVSPENLLKSTSVVFGVGSCCDSDEILKPSSCLGSTVSGGGVTTNTFWHLVHRTFTPFAVTFESSRR